MQASTERQLPPKMGLDSRTLSGEELDQEGRHAVF